MAGSGQADCQNASPRYSRSSHRLHLTTVNQNRVHSTAASTMRSSEVESRQTVPGLSASARAFRMLESSEHTAIITAEMENRKAVWLTVTFAFMRQRKSQKVHSTMGRSKKLLSSSKIVHSAAHTRHTAVMPTAAMQAVRLGLRTFSHRQARHRKPLGYSRA